MAERFKHLPLVRLAPVNQKRRAGGGGPTVRPDDPAQHASGLLRQVDEAEARRVEPGFDPRLLIKLTVVPGTATKDFDNIDGLEIVSQEGNTVVVLFATADGLREFRRRLSQISHSEHATRSDLVFAIQRFDAWSEEDRTGPALRLEALPPGDQVVLDVELWPIERGAQRNALVAAFRAWCAGHAIDVLDMVDKSAVLLCRVRAPRSAVASLLRQRDARFVDLPPRYRMDAALLREDLMSFSAVPAPPDGAPGVVVLDSGLNAGHPLLEAAVGDRQTFVAGLGIEDDPSGHGTMVAGIALYGDVLGSIEKRTFAPDLWLHSGRVIGDEDAFSSKLIHNRIVEAVRYFKEHYGCRVFNLSIGDEHKPYRGGHVRDLAVALDEIARDEGVLLVVAAGNYPLQHEPTPAWQDYPDYLTHGDAARILDPAPALNVLTVGSIARFDATRLAHRFPSDVNQRAVARHDEPSPFSRSGPGPGGAIKPDVVDYGGNQAVNLRDDSGAWQQQSQLGEVTLAGDFATSARLFRDASGTSFAAPRITHLAATVLRDYPSASANLLRALIVAHADAPRASRELLDDDEALLRLVGYGQPDGEAVVASAENCVTLIAEDEAGPDQHLFYEIPLPEDFVAPRRSAGRALRVGLAHMPSVRTTRIEYRASRFQFRVVRESSLEAVSNYFRYVPAPPKGERSDEPVVKEIADSWPGARRRDAGTVQGARFDLETITPKVWNGKKLFVVVTRIVPAWARGGIEKEPFALAVVLDHRSSIQARLYSQLRVRIRV